MPKPGWTEGLGELVRAHRLYTGLSPRAFADECGIREQSLIDIETGRRDTPDGLMQTVEKVVERFDDEVEQVVRRAEEMLVGKEDATVHLEVTDEYGKEWQRAVVGRAAVTSGLVFPKTPVGWILGR